MKHNFKRKLYNNILRFIIYLFTFITVSLLGLIIGFIFYKGLGHISLEFLTTIPKHSTNHIGILPNIINTIYIILLTLFLALPLGIGSAIYLTEYAKNKKFIDIVEFTTEILAGIPSIIYGLVGMLLFVRTLGFKVSLLSGSLTMTIIVLPIIIRTTQESLKSVPQSYREGSLGLGSGKWHMIKTVVLPSCIEGILTGCILAIGRIVGESAALLYTSGMGTVLASNIIDAFNTGGGTLSVSLYMYSSQRGEFDVSYAIASVLLILVFLINLGTKLIKNTIKKRQYK